MENKKKYEMRTVIYGGIKLEDENGNTFPVVLESWESFDKIYYEYWTNPVMLCRLLSDYAVCFADNEFALTVLGEWLKTKMMLEFSALSDDGAAECRYNVLKLFNDIYRTKVVTNGDKYL